MKILMLIVLGIIIPCTNATAETVTRLIEFSAGNFAPAGSLFNTATGEFSFTYDDSAPFTNDAVPDAVSVIIGATTYTTANTRVDIQRLGSAEYEIVFGALTGENQGIFTGIPNDFILTFRLVNGEVIAPSFQYTGAGPQIFNAQTTSVTNTMVLTPQPVPIPNVSLALLALGMAYIARRRVTRLKV